MTSEQRLRQHCQDLVDMWNDDAAYLEEVGSKPGNEGARGQAAIMKVLADQLHKVLVTTEAAPSAFPTRQGRDRS